MTNNTIPSNKQLDINSFLLHLFICAPAIYLSCPTLVLWLCWTTFYNKIPTERSIKDLNVECVILLMFVE